MRAALLLVIALFCLPALAADPICLPAPLGPGMSFHAGWSTNGQWAWWYCPVADGSVDGAIVRVRYIATRTTTLRQIGDRVDTIVNSTAPLTAAQTAAKRYATLPVTDPSLAAVYADYLADLNANLP